MLRLAWNSTLPDLFQTPRISTWQAAKLILIAAVLLSPVSIRVIDTQTQPEALSREEALEMFQLAPDKEHSPTDHR